MKYFLVVIIGLTLTACASTTKSVNESTGGSMCNDAPTLPGESKPHRKPFNPPSPHIEHNSLRNI